VRSAHVASTAFLAAAFAGLVAACGGTTVFDAPDPEACASGHGCPMVGCACTDGSIIFDTTCRKGNCVAPQDICPDRCAPYGGPSVAFATEDDEVPVPACDTFCARLDTNGCELGCDTLFSTCLAPTECSSDAAAFWKCIVTEGVMTCEDNYVRVEGCDGSKMSLCTK
jgi:hypothetical protein